jgi:hypothetical protein
VTATPARAARTPGDPAGHRVPRARGARRGRTGDAGVTEGRYVVDPALGRPERGPTLERYVFRFGYHDRAVTLQIRGGFVTDEFVALSRRLDRTAAEQAHLTVLKQEMADRLLAAAPEGVYDVVDRPG